MNKKVLIVISVIILLICAIFFVFKNSNNAKEEAQKTNNGNGSEMIFFYSNGCVHCKNVEKFLSENTIVEEKVKFEKLEVGNINNAKLMAGKAKLCGMSGNNLPVPLFWDGSKCLTGDEDIIDFLKNKAGIQQ